MMGFYFSYFSRTYGNPLCRTLCYNAATTVYIIYIWTPLGNALLYKISILVSNNVSNNTHLLAATGERFQHCLVWTVLYDTLERHALRHDLTTMFHIRCKRLPSNIYIIETRHVQWRQVVLILIWERIFTPRETRTRREDTQRSSP